MPTDKASLSVITCIFSRDFPLFAFNQELPKVIRVFLTLYDGQFTTVTSELCTQISL